MNPQSRVWAVFCLAVFASLTLTQAFQTNLTGPEGSGNFGVSVTVLPNGNFVVTDPLYDAPGPIPDVGAVYLYDGDTLNPISKLTGSIANDKVGSGLSYNDGITVLPNGNFVVKSPSWKNGGLNSTGAVTWCSGTTGLSGIISASNSLVGSIAGDRVGDDLYYGNTVKVLRNGNYVVNSPNWSDGLVVAVGAVTWGSAASGVSGVISSANSLIGTTAQDRIGTGASGTYILSNGNYIVCSAEWDLGGIRNVGAVTWGNGTTGIQGVISVTNSLIGGTADDIVGGAPIIDLTNGNFLINSNQWDNGSRVDAGAVTWLNGSTGITGVVSGANSLIGSSSQDHVGAGEITVLPSGNYLINSWDWDNGMAENAGAVTWGSGTQGVKGVVSAVNSLVGDNFFDEVGQNRISTFPCVTVLKNGNYVICSTSWSGSRGAVTWGSATSGVKGNVSATNSLVGNASFDSNVVGFGGVTPLSNGNYVVCSPVWDNGAASNVGAVTWGNGSTGVTGLVSVTNSLIGNLEYSDIGNPTITGQSGIIALSDGNYLVNSHGWDNESIADAGAVTWGSGTSGVKGVISAANSLVGRVADDSVGSYGVVALENGNYVVISPLVNNAGVADVGAVTWGSGSSGVKGTVSSSNSLIGSSNNDQIGSSGVNILADGSYEVRGSGVIALSNSNYVVRSGLWDNGLVRDVGAVTWGSGASGVKGVVSISNSLVGSAADDTVGHFDVRALRNGNYVVISPDWDQGAVSDAGAVTWVNGTMPVSGQVSPANSLVGSSPNDQVGGAGFTALSNGNYLVLSALWNLAGAVTWSDASTGLTGIVSETNSLVGSTPGDKIASVTGNRFIPAPGISLLSNGNYLVSSPDWDNGAVGNTGAVTWGGGLTGVKGKVSEMNSLIGTSPNDALGMWNNLALLQNGNYFVLARRWNNGAINDAGSVTPGDGTAGTNGVIGADNSILGTSAGAGSDMVLAHDFLRSRVFLSISGSNKVGVLSYGAELSVSGNGMAIADGLGVPGMQNHTDFGSAAVMAGAIERTFTISNRGIFGLNLAPDSAVSIAGLNAPDFRVTTQPVTMVPGGGAVQFRVGFDPSALDLRTAMVSIGHSLGKNGSYQFAIQGTGQTAIEAWRSLYFGGASVNTGDLEDYDGDGLLNLLEFAFGTDPVNSTSGLAGLQYAGTFAGNGTIGATGQPVTVFETLAGVNEFRVLFVRLKDYLGAGLTYSMQFSDDLASWQSNDTQPILLAENGKHEIVSLPYPIIPGGRQAGFAKLKVIFAP